MRSISDLLKGDLNHSIKLLRSTPRTDQTNESGTECSIAFRGEERIYKLLKKDRCSDLAPGHRREKKIENRRSKIMSIGVTESYVSSLTCL